MLHKILSISSAVCPPKLKFVLAKKEKTIDSVILNWIGKIGVTGLISMRGGFRENWKVKFCELPRRACFHFYMNFTNQSQYNTRYQTKYPIIINDFYLLLHFIHTPLFYSIKRSGEQQSFEQPIPSSCFLSP